LPYVRSAPLELRDLSNRWRFNTQAKFIYLLDRVQVPPIGEKVTLLLTAVSCYDLQAEQLFTVDTQFFYIFNHILSNAFWREHLLFPLFPLGGITDFLGRFLKHH
jgi:hypothetical protein